MDIFLTFLAFFVFFGIASAQAGYSFKFFNNKLQDWQNKIPLGNRIPEFAIAIMFGIVAIYGWDDATSMIHHYTSAFPVDSVNSLLITCLIFFVFFFGISVVAAFVGKESATVYYLPGNWDTGWTRDDDGDGDIDFDDGRKSTMRPFNDVIAKMLGVNLNDKWYPKIWAFTKGLLISIPIGFLCAPFMPLTRHIGIRFGEWMNKRYGHDVNTYAELVGDGLAYSAGCTLFLNGGAVFISGAILFIIQLF